MGRKASYTGQRMAWRGLPQNNSVLSTLCCVMLKHDHLCFELKCLEPHLTLKPRHCTALKSDQDRQTCVNGCRGVGTLEGLSYESANQQLQEGDSLSPNWRPRLGTDGTPNESSQDVLIRVRQVGLRMTTAASAASHCRHATAF